ncbi:uncharacterized protein PAC_08904 [Phialocephala subalpina]|uniref:Uncharacterized protein n=1 Tax=Phialocephala subalpina TaxID=576137 RepID=A0A1L7X1X8_9HELO|nr:uncharacterized protein PAC_08904 [Phialocephala subalpina]
MPVSQNEPPSPVAGQLQRISTGQLLEALDKTQRPQLQAWYEPGTDLCYYETALKAAGEANTRLMAAQFSDSEKALLSQNLDPGVIVKYFERQQESITLIHQQREANPKLIHRARRLGIGFVKVAMALDPIISIVIPSSPEYAIPYGCLKLIFKFVLDNASDRQEEILDHLMALSEILSTMSFQNDMEPTGPMKKLMATIYVHVLDFLERLIEYTNLSSWGRLQKALQSKARKDYKFGERLKQINDFTTQLASLAQKSIEAMEAETFHLTKLTAAGMRLYLLSRESGSATSSSITILERNISDLYQATQLWTRSQASANAYNLLDILLPGENDIQDELDLWDGVTFRLSLGDYWERNGILEEFSLWGENRNVPFLAIGPYGSKDSWVTNFSLDLISLLRSQKQLTTFALCDRPDVNKPWSPTRLMKQLVGQLLEQNPMLMLQEPQIFNTRNFQNAKEMPQVWRIFKKIAAKMDSLFIVIDRIDRCEGEDTMDISIGDDLLRMLSDLVTLHEGKIKLIVTSAEQPPVELCEELRLYTVINTQAPQRRRIWESDDDASSGTQSLVDD